MLKSFNVTFNVCHFRNGDFYVLSFFSENHTLLSSKRFSSLDEIKSLFLEAFSFDGDLPVSEY